MSRAAGVRMVFAATLLMSCRNDMHDQPKYKPFERSLFFKDGQSARPLIEGTIARGQLRDDTRFFLGRTERQPTAVAAPGVTVPGATAQANAASQKAVAGSISGPATAGASGSAVAADRGPQSSAPEQAFANTFDASLVREFPLPINEAMLARGRNRYNIFCSPCHDYVGYGRGMIVQRGLTPPPSFHIARLREAPVGHIFDVITNGYGAMYSYASRVPVADRWAIIAYVRALQLSQSGTAADVPPDQKAALDKSPANLPLGRPGELQPSSAPPSQQLHDIPREGGPEVK